MMKTKKKCYLLVSLCLLAQISVAQKPEAIPVSPHIRLNQLGFYPGAPKIAIITRPGGDKFSIVANGSNKVVFSGNLKQSITPALNGEKTWIANFTAFIRPGKYKLAIDGLGSSFPFTIDASIFKNIAAASVKIYYYQRASINLSEQCAGIWHRTAGHPDDKVLIHPSAATASRPTGTLIATPGGWYDAGDYNKYIVNSGITMGTLLSLCEDFPEEIKIVNLNIPESKNRVPDILDEIVYNLRWMLTMQDPDDGGVYNKTTNAAFDGFVMPWVTIAPRYVVQKGTAAALDFAAVTAQAVRVLKPFSKELPGLADSCLAASIKAWKWAKQNPSLAYDQNAMNEKFSPKITTGGYGDGIFTDEFIWAACELYLTTGSENYYRAVDLLPDKNMQIPSWAQVKLLGYYSLVRNSKNLRGGSTQLADTLKKRMIGLADGLIKDMSSSAYSTVMGRSARDFSWGSNSQAGNQGVALVQAYLISGDKKYLDAALSNLDYLLGRNGTGYSYVTGYGSKTPMHPHHRISAADGVIDPIPGLLVGGPNPGRQDGANLPSIVPDEAYTDNEQAYAVNEIAINWNAPFAYLANALQALRYKIGYAK